MVITVLDASGAVLGELDTVGGTVDYSAYADTSCQGHCHEQCRRSGCDLDIP